ncbi:gamma-glutamylcyclotransferase family protein [Sulfuriroseicoccus oceanibius]|uniref:Gamma-glutamylcyclotransferase n=1 Tax=Sulfuriroseicoccus oceanibius TaxID=2707525 RepID=A0A6B3L656_9BACT|nr:gamma-glutamylcyclotransferase family protein [Sulfuriroseicoccus oceanibius]QQL46090.1 gamma-glutamylcyclotransferase [Sulfuriroseicoccus oceanibius]
MFRLFVYGSLKRGLEYHDRFCSGAEDITQATLHGKLFHLEEGYPGLILPESTILAHGCTDYLRDLEIQDQHNALSPLPETPPADTQCVHGELMHFPNPIDSLPAIDWLEEFTPGEPSPYQRVLTTIMADHRPLAAWTYIATDLAMPNAIPVPNGNWTGPPSS